MKDWMEKLQGTLILLFVALVIVFLVGGIEGLRWIVILLFAALVIAFWLIVVSIPWALGSWVSKSKMNIILKGFLYLIILVIFAFIIAAMTHFYTD